MGKSQIDILIFANGLCVATIGGIYYGFSTFVMQALAQLPFPQGVLAMQTINRVVINPFFIAPFLLSAIVALFLGIFAIKDMSLNGKTVIIFASLIYFIGSFAVTMLFNVPLNDKLAAVNIQESANFWNIYLEKWVFWNSIRSASSILSAAIYFTYLIKFAVKQ